LLILQFGTKQSNAQRLLHSLAQARKGQFSEKQLIKE